MLKKQCVYLCLAILLTFSVCNTSSTISQKILRQKIVKGKNGKEIRVSYISMTKFEDKMLIKTPIKSIFVHSINECKAECIKNTGCVSLNLIVENVTYFRCQLLDGTHYKQPYLLVDADDADHHTLSVSKYSSKISAKQIIRLIAASAILQKNNSMELYSISLNSQCSESNAKRSKEVEKATFSSPDCGPKLRLKTDQTCYLSRRILIIETWTRINLDIQVCPNFVICTSEL